jgi:hypothetical protein
MAECARCDVYFGFEEVYAIPLGEKTAEEAKMAG